MNRSFSHVDSNNIPLDIKLDYLFNNKENGFFIELGANDGLTQSNTAFFEFTRNWKGILIEPSIVGYESCIKNRPNSKVYNCCCVSNNYNENYIEGDFNGHPMSSVNGNRLYNNNLVKANVKTLEQILDENINKNDVIDFLSLDVEGYEFNVIEGLNIDKYRPKCMLIEIYNTDYDKIYNYLISKNYILHSNFTTYNNQDNPNWDGTHNDYLFIAL